MSTKADIVFPNETQTQISANPFDNYTIISSIGGSSGGVAVLLKNHIPYSRLNQLEDISVDNVDLTVRLSGIRLVVSTAYCRPEDFEGLRSTIKVIQSCKTYGHLFCGTSSRICCTKLPLVIYPSNVFQIIATVLELRLDRRKQ